MTTTSKVTAAIIAIAAIVGITIAYYYWPSATVPSVPAPLAPQAAAPAPIAEPRIRFPVPEQPEQKPLPSLGESDSFIQTILTSLYGRESLVRFFRLQDFARHFVATIDNLPRQAAAVRLMPVNPVPGAFVVSSKQGEVDIS